MKNSLLGLALAALIAVPAHSAITVPGANGSDGALNITQDTVIDLSLAPNGVWNSNSPTPGKGIYDPEKWAVVFHYTSVNIAAGATVTFKNNAARAPVVWLVNGDVTINGTISLDGSAAMSDNLNPVIAPPGPGGYRSGRLFPTGPPTILNATAGFGPGGGTKPMYAPFQSPGSYAVTSPGEMPGLPYGNAALIPLMGGSGGAGRIINGASSGGGGGGAILVAATGSIAIGGVVHANGGDDTYNWGSGGAIRLVADTVTGFGQLQAQGPIAHSPAPGRIRIEANRADSTLDIAPAPSGDRPANPVKLWPDALDPSARIVSIGKEIVPVGPSSQFGTDADVKPDIIDSAAGVTAIIETKNVPTTATVNLRMAPPVGDAVLLPAVLASGNLATATWQVVNLNPPAGTTMFQVRVEAPGQ